MIDRRALAKRWLTAAQVEAGPRRLSKQQCRVIVAQAFRAADDYNMREALRRPARSRTRAWAGKRPSMGGPPLGG